MASNSLPEKQNGVTLKDLKIRCANIRKSYPDIENCSVKGCANPVDITEGMGKDTTCPYHRLLFDFWIYEVVPEPLEIIKMPKEKRRKKFEEYMENIGQASCDAIVLRLAQEPINWSC